MRAHLLPLALLAALAARADELRPHARAGERRRVEFEQALRLELVSQEDSVITEGEESPPSSGTPAGFVVEEREEVAFDDEVLSAEAGAPRALRRTFARLASRSSQTVTTAAAGERVRAGDGASPLAGRAVRFELEPESARWNVRFDDGREGDEAWLAGLVARWELALFLPDHPVEPGDEWDVPLSALRELSYPSGDLLVHIEGDERGDTFGREFHAHMRGAIRASYLGRRAHEGRELAVVRLESELATAFALAEDPAVQREYEFELALAGELLWDPAAGRAAALDWSGPVKATTVTTRTGSEFALRTRQRFDGSLRFALRVE